MEHKWETDPPEHFGYYWFSKRENGVWGEPQVVHVVLEDQPGICMKQMVYSAHGDCWPIEETADYLLYAWGGRVWPPPKPEA